MGSHPGAQDTWRPCGSRFRTAENLSDSSGGSAPEYGTQIARVLYPVKQHGRFGQFRQIVINRCRNQENNVDPVFNLTQRPEQAVGQKKTFAVSLFTFVENRCHFPILSGRFAHDTQSGNADMFQVRLAQMNAIQYRLPTFAPCS